MWYLIHPVSDHTLFPPTPVPPPDHVVTHYSQSPTSTLASLVLIYFLILHPEGTCSPLLQGPLPGSLLLSPLTHSQVPILSGQKLTVECRRKHMSMCPSEPQFPCFLKILVISFFFTTEYSSQLPLTPSLTAEGKSCRVEASMKA